MFFRSKKQADNYCRSQQADIPNLRGRLFVIADRRARWSHTEDDFIRESGWTVAIR